MQQFAQLAAAQRAFFQTGKTRTPAYRKKALSDLKGAVTAYGDRLLAALKADLNKSAFEAYETELGIVLAELGSAQKSLGKWTKPRRVGTPLTHFPGRSRIYPEPYGVALILSPWNYPLQLTLTPLIGAIAAGNCAVIKPSNDSGTVSRVLKEMLETVFPPEYVAVVLGGREANGGLLEEKFDYIFFTGSVAVGKMVMAAAAKNLTPVTLELGGKSPCIVDETADIDAAARRIIWGKLVNAGQTCVAPDYLYVHRSVKEQLIARMAHYSQVFYTENPLAEDTLPKIISWKHFDRLMGLMDSGNIVLGGESDPERLRIAPTILDGVDWDAPIMGEEIFGPLLPVLTFETLTEVIETVTARPKPLALYLFTSSDANRRLILERISFGGGCVNDTIMHVAAPKLPFGGVGASGMGHYHGKASFDTFTHYKGVYHKGRRPDIALRYPPFDGKETLLKRMLR